VPQQTNKQNSFLYQVAQLAQVNGDGWATDKLMVVGKDIQTKQR